MKQPTPVRSFAVYLVVRGALAALALLPRRAGRATGRVLGRLFYRISTRHRRIARDNLRLAFGHLIVRHKSF